MLRGWLLGTLLAAAMVAPAAAQDSQTRPSAPPRDPPAAVVDGEAIPASEVDASAGVELATLEQQMYALRRRALDNVIAQRTLLHEAGKRKTTADALLAEAGSRAAPVTGADVEAFYQAHRAALQGKGTELQARAAIRVALQAERMKAARAALLQTLVAGAHVTVALAAPPERRFDVATNDSPELGPPDAPVTLVEFSDFHCPFCKRIEDSKTLTALRARYGDRLRIVWVDDPIDALHPRSRAAHEAARCALEQGRFWPYHDALYAGPPKSGDDLRAAAGQVGLDLAAFDACVASGREKAVVQRGVDEAARLGISGTPTFFVNGRVLLGAQPIEAFTRAIDQELARTAAPAAGR